MSFERSLTRNARTVDVYNAESLGPLSLAPDGIMRATLKNDTFYRVINQFVWPKVLMPKVVTPGIFDFITIGSRSSGFTTVEIDSTDAPWMWGRDIGAINFDFTGLIDVSNSGAGLGSTVADLVGGNGNLSVMAGSSYAVINFKSWGNLVDCGLFYSPNSQTFGLESGVTMRITPANAAEGQSNGINNIRFLGNSAAADQRRPTLTFIGDTPESAINGNLVSLGKTGNSFIHIDSGTTQGNYNIIGQSYRGGTAGAFFRPDEVEAITTQANADITITSFSDSTANPGNDTTVNFGSIVDFIRGQVILIADEAAYDGTHTIVRVADDQMSFDINVTFSTLGAGTLKMVQHTVADCKFARDETVTVTLTSNDGTAQVLRQTDTTFNLPQAFTAGDLVGTATSIGKTEQTLGVITTANGAQPDSTVSAEASFTNASPTATDIPAVDALVIINESTWAGDEESRITVNSDGSSSYIGETSINLKLDGNITVEPSSSTKDLSCQFVRQTVERRIVTFTNGTNVVNETSTPRVDGDTITFHDNAGTLPAELREDIVYFVVTQTTNTFQLSYTSGGAVITFTDDGSGTNTYAVAQTHGSSPSNNIAANNPRTLVPQASSPIDSGDVVFVVVSNKDDAIDVEVTIGYYRVFI